MLIIFDALKRIPQNPVVDHQILYQLKMIKVRMLKLPFWGTPISAKRRFLRCKSYNLSSSAFVSRECPTVGDIMPGPCGVRSSTEDVDDVKVSNWVHPWTVHEQALQGLTMPSSYSICFCTSSAARFRIVSFPPRYVQIVSEQWIIDQCVFSNMSRVQGTNDTTYWILSCVNQPKCNNRNQIPFQCGVAVEDRCTDFSVPPERSSVCSVRGRPEITGYEIRRKISCHCWIRSCQICQLLDERSAGPFFGG